MNIFNLVNEFIQRERRRIRLKKAEGGSPAGGAATVVAQMSGEELRRLLEFITRMEGNPETEAGT